MSKPFPLNPEQLDAVRTIRGPLLILAGAGTGKTRVITQRVAYMLENGISPYAIVALTFTNKAAREMRERIGENAKGEKLKQLFIGTFHSFCLQILRSNSEAAGLEKRFTIASASDQVDLVRRALEECKWSGIFKAEQFLQQISRAKNDLLSPEELARLTNKHIPFVDIATVAEVYAIYEKHLRINHLIDFDDCIFRVVRLVRSNPDVKKTLLQKFQYFLVDEFQDTNFSQLELLREFCEGHRNICVVGDDDQSIYSWRGAMVETIFKFEELFPERKFIKLEQNYRCTPVILEAANTVIKNNTARKDKKLWSDFKETTPIHVEACENESSENQFVTDKIIGLLGEGFKPSDIGILYRANNLARGFEMMLREHQIPYKTFGGQSFFERKEVKDFMSYLRLIYFPQDRLAFFRVINTPSRGIGIKTLERVESLSKSLRKNPFAIAESATSEEFGKQAELLRAFAAKIREISKEPVGTPEEVEGLGNKIIKAFGLAEDIKLKTEQAASRERKLECLRSMPKWIRQCAKDAIDENQGIDMLQLLDKLTLNERDSSEDEEKKGNTVSLMTIHAAKGLEFTNVFVVGCEEDILPHKNSLTEKHGLAEERRLFYVALTRAKKRLHLSYCLERFMGGQSGSIKVPSRFLSEIPTTNLVALTGEQIQQQKEEKKENFLSALKTLKSELSKR